MRGERTRRCATKSKGNRERSWRCANRRRDDAHSTQRHGRETRWVARDRQGEIFARANLVWMTTRGRPYSRDVSQGDFSRRTIKRLRGHSIRHRDALSVRESRHRTSTDSIRRRDARSAAARHRANASNLPRGRLVLRNSSAARAPHTTPRTASPPRHRKLTRPCPPPPAPLTRPPTPRVPPQPRRPAPRLGLLPRPSRPYLMSRTAHARRRTARRACGRRSVRRRRP